MVYNIESQTAGKNKEKNQYLQKYISRALTADLLRSFHSFTVYYMLITMKQKFSAEEKPSTSS